MTEKTRVRFAPSPTGPLHVGGIRTAMYAYLFARKHNGTFILRIEDTDQNRFVPGAEEYIVESLNWCGLVPDEGPGIGGDYGPYRQSERKDIYQKHALQLVENGHAYYAFDTSEELEKKRQAEKEKGNHSFKYDARIRKEMKNSLTLSAAEVQQRLANKEPFTIRLKVPDNQSIRINDLVRGEVVVHTAELDDKVLIKGDGMPTYHLANIVDDHLMEISHVIRGEEWLPSIAHHVLLYRFLGWEDAMPQFAHLPLILKPTGKGKLSKRDGAKFGMPVFPISWKGDTEGESFEGFREVGFLPKAVVNFLALLGWNPGTEQEIFSLEELCSAFSIEKIGKAGARFNYDKAKWFNQQYVSATDQAELAKLVRPQIEAKGHQPSEDYLAAVCGILKERLTLLTDFWELGHYFFEDVRTFDTKTIRKRWKAERREKFEKLNSLLNELEPFGAPAIENSVKEFISESGLKFGEVFPILRIALSGSMKGPAVFEMMALLGKAEVVKRLQNGFAYFDTLT